MASPGVDDALRSVGIEPRKIGFAQTVWYFDVTRTLYQRTDQHNYSLQDRSVVTVASYGDAIPCFVAAFQFSVRLNGVSFGRTSIANCCS